MGRFDDLMRQAGLHALAKGPQQETATEGYKGETPIEEHGYAYVTRRPGFTLTGPRGRDPGGYPKLIPAGMPPAVFGEPARDMLPKELEIPPRPLRAVKFIAVAALASGEIMNTELAFPARTLYVDNYSHVWILVDGVQRWIPPITIGWVMPVYQAMTQLHITGAAPGGHTQPSLTAGDIINVIAYEGNQPFSPGVAVPT